MALCGGFGATKEVTSEEQTILDGVKADVEGHIGKSSSTFKALAFQTQVVAGVNYVFKVQLDDSVIHVKVAKPLPHTNKPPFLLGVDSKPHTVDSEFASF